MGESNQKKHIKPIWMARAIVVELVVIIGLFIFIAVKLSNDKKEATELAKEQAVEVAQSVGALNSSIASDTKAAAVTEEKADEVPEAQDAQPEAEAAQPEAEAAQPEAPVTEVKTEQAAEETAPEVVAAAEPETTVKAQEEVTVASGMSEFTASEPTVLPKRSASAMGQTLAEADIKAAMYDYDVAIALVQSVEGYESNSECLEAIASYEEAKSKCVAWANNTEISHIFVHSLIVDTDRAFGPTSSQPVGYNQYMTTVLEFNRMLEQMYEKGYVLISIHDIAKRVIDENGEEKLVKNPIMLPPGKIPFVLSQDDVNYYLYMEGDGFADCLVVGDDGIPTCKYTDVEGHVHYGEYDVLPIVDRFVREHPDFSYRGAKGILAVTGYEGALGYDTGSAQWDLDDPDQAAKRAELQEEVKVVAAAIRADGWEFASHSYTHTNMTNNSLERVIYDTNRWKAEVEPLIGETDIYIYPFGADICSWRGYEGDKYDTLKAAGFWYFCNVDSAQYWIQLRDKYMRMGRINTDGERFVKTPEKLAYFFDVDTVFDTSRPKLNVE